MSAQGVQCKCGRFLANVHATASRERLEDVRGNCSRCGENVPAAPQGPWWDWDNWTWTESSR